MGGKKQKYNFQNNTGSPLYVITGSKWSFDAYEIPAEGEQKVKISQKFGLVEKTSVAPGNREMTATMFEVSSLGEIQISKTKSKFIANLVQPSKSGGDELRNIGAKLYKDKENWTRKDVANYVLKGVTIVVGLASIAIGAVALAGAAAAGAVAAGAAGVAVPDGGVSVLDGVVPEVVPEDLALDQMNLNTASEATPT